MTEIPRDRSISATSRARRLDSFLTFYGPGGLATPDDVEALVMRGTAYRFVENAELAMADVERALVLQPDHLGARLERGNLRRLIGDDDGARADWIKLLQTDPESIPADAARANIAKLDVKIEN